MTLIETTSDIFTSFVKQENKNYRNYILEEATHETDLMIKKLRKENKIRLSILNVELLRSNGENYIIYIRYGTHWIKEWSNDLILWSETKKFVKKSLLRNFHFIIQEYKSININ